MNKKVLKFSFLVITLITMSLFTSCKNEKKVEDVGGDTPTDSTNVVVNPEGVGEFNPLAFDYEAKKPVDGNLKGVVELGASGFNWFLVEIDKDKNWSLKDAKYGDGDSGIFENDATVESVKEKLQAYIQSLLKTDVKGKDIHFVVSSGAEKEDVTKRIVSTLRGLGYVVNTVTPEQEGQYALSAVLPVEYKDNSFVVDIGSSNTKISYFEGDKVVGLETHGSKYYKKNLDPKVIYDEVKAEVSKVPENKRKYCFIIGGVPFKFAKEVRNKNERYTTLNAPASYNPKKEKEIAGKNIYQAIVDGTGTQTYIFDWDANFTIGFLLSL